MVLSFGSSEVFLNSLSLLIQSISAHMHMKFYMHQGATKVLSDSPGLVELSIGLAHSDHGLPDGQATQGQEILFFYDNLQK